MTRWDFGDLPEKVEVSLHGTTLLGFPALVDDGARPSRCACSTRPRPRTRAHRGRRAAAVHGAARRGGEAPRPPAAADSSSCACTTSRSAAATTCKRDLMDAIADRASGELTGVRTQAEFIAHAGDAAGGGCPPAATEVTDLAWAGAVGVPRASTQRAVARLPAAAAGQRAATCASSSPT